MENFGVIITSLTGLLVIGITIVLFVYIYRAKSFTPTEDKDVQLEKVNKLLNPFGFGYDMGQDVFFSLKDCPQRKVGYCQLYDEGSPFFNMVMDCEPVTFYHEGKQWLIEFWKGQYGITTGAEVGIYNAEIKDDEQDFSNTFYECAKKDEEMPMSITLYKNGRELFKRSGRHWWLTGFLLGEFSEKDELTAGIRIKFPTKSMRDAFLDALYDVGYGCDQISTVGTSVGIKFEIPKTVQPSTQKGVQEDLVQAINENNCKLFEAVTKKYPDTLDKIEYIMALEPNLTDILFKSLYSNDFYKAGLKKYDVAGG